MKKLLTFVLGSTALIGVSMVGPAQAEPDYAYAATGFVGGGASWLDLSTSGNIKVKCRDSCDSEIAHIVGGGDIVLPLHGYWNVQLGGAFHTDHEHFDFGGSNSTTQFQGGVIGFWRDPAMGVFGIEAGFFSPFGNEGGGFQNSVKIGGVAEYFFSDMITIGGFGGALIPMDENPFGGSGKSLGPSKSIDTGFYAGGHLTYYASDNLAFAGFARFTELNSGGGSGQITIDNTDRSLNVGGQVRYLTSMPGVEIYASGSYRECESESSRTGEEVGFSSTFTEDGAQFMGGVKIRLGGHSDSLVAIDRSNAIDTRAWACGGDFLRSPN